MTRRRQRRPFLRTVVVALLVALPAVGVVLVLRAHPPRVVLAGDSIMWQSAPSVAQELAGYQVVTDAVSGSGLLSRGAYDWDAAVRRLAAERPRVAVLLFIGNCTQPLGADPSGRPITCDTPEFFAAWQRAAVDATHAFTDRGAKVLWVLPPPVRDRKLEARVDRLSEGYREIARSIPGVGLVDGRAALGGLFGQYVDSLAGPDGSQVRLRTPDGVHLSQEGAHRLGTAIARAIAATD